MGVTLQIGRKIQAHLSHIMRKPVLPYANNKGADQPAHPRSLISAFVVRCLDSIIPLVSISEISSLYLASVAAQAGLSLTWSQTPSTGFLVTRPILGRNTLVSRIQKYKKRCKLNEPRHEKPVFGVCDQVRLKPVYSSIETRYSLGISAIASGGIILSKQRTTKVLIRLRGCACLSAPLLFAYGINRFFMACLK